MNWGDGIDTTEESVIWVDGETTGLSGQGEIVTAPAPEDIEQTLRGQILDLLQDGGLDFLKRVIPDHIFVEIVEPKEEGGDVNDGG